MKRQDIINELKKKTNKNKKECEFFYDTLIDIFKESLSKNEKIIIYQFGILKPFYREGKRRYIPLMNKYQTVPNRTLIKFIPAKALNELVNKENNL